MFQRLKLPERTFNTLERPLARMQVMGLKVGCVLRYGKKILELQFIFIYSVPFKMSVFQIFYNKYSNTYLILNEYAYMKVHEVFHG